ncbi:hypothetical protein BC826DRAFT_152574 [Russula brevipes]|nr:hypothetical protein BC826DRAFT_152574 [Russula brevipes]
MGECSRFCCRWRLFPNHVPVTLLSKPVRSWAPVGISLRPLPIHVAFPSHAFPPWDRSIWYSRVRCPSLGLTKAHRPHQLSACAHMKKCNVKVIQPGLTRPLLADLLCIASTSGAFSSSEAVPKAPHRRAPRKRRWNGGNARTHLDKLIHADVLYFFLHCGVVGSIKTQKRGARPSRSSVVFSAPCYRCAPLRLPCPTRLSG